MEAKTELILKKFNEWADEIIASDNDWQPQSHKGEIIKETKRDTLNFAKSNLKRIIKEVSDV